MAEKAIKSLDQLLEHELQDLYDAEHQLTEALPKMAKAASYDELRAGFQYHFEQTQEHIKRLEQVFKLLGKKATRKPCKAMKGLIAESEETMEEKMDAAVMDAALIVAAQKVEHYEIAGYGSVAMFANMIGKLEVENLLRQTLGEEQITDNKLTQIALNVNALAREKVQ